MTSNSFIVLAISAVDHITLLELSHSSTIDVSLDCIDLPPLNDSLRIEARDFLRKNLLGVTVDFIATHGRFSGHIIHPEGGNVALPLLRQGFCTLTSHASRDRQWGSDLAEAEAIAKKKAAGLHATSRRVGEPPRELNPFPKNKESIQELAGHLVGTTVRVCVDRCLSSTSFEAHVVPALQVIRFKLCGAYCTGVDSIINDVRTFAQQRLMHRTISIQVEEFDENTSTFFVTLGAEASYVTDALSAGYACIDHRTLAYCKNAVVMMAAESESRASKKGLFAMKDPNEFHLPYEGVVAEVLSETELVVECSSTETSCSVDAKGSEPKSEPSKAEDPKKRVTVRLAFVQPEELVDVTQPSKSEGQRLSMNGAAYEGREILRHVAIGCDIRVFPVTTDRNDVQIARCFVRQASSEDGHSSSSVVDLSMLMIRAGLQLQPQKSTFSFPIPPTDDLVDVLIDDESTEAQQMMNAARNTQIEIKSAVTATALRKCFHMDHPVWREGFRGVVEEFKPPFSFVVHWEAERILVPVSLAGIRHTTFTEGDSQDPLHAELEHFIARYTLHRDVEVQLLKIQPERARSGASLKALVRVRGMPTDLTSALLQNGMGIVGNVLRDGMPLGLADQMQRELAVGQDHGVGLWSSRGKAALEEMRAQRLKETEITLPRPDEETSILARIVAWRNPFEFSFQPIGSTGHVYKLENVEHAVILARNASKRCTDIHSISAGEYVLSQFEGVWHRCEVLGIDEERGGVIVDFIDFGDTQLVPVKLIEVLPSRAQQESLMSINPLARHAQHAFIKYRDNLPVEVLKMLDDGMRVLSQQEIVRIQLEYRHKHVACVSVLPFDGGSGRGLPVAAELLAQFPDNVLTVVKSCVDFPQLLKKMHKLLAIPRPQDLPDPRPVAPPMDMGPYPTGPADGPPGAIGAFVEGSPVEKEEKSSRRTRNKRGSRSPPPDVAPSAPSPIVEIPSPVQPKEPKRTTPPVQRSKVPPKPLAALDEISSDDDGDFVVPSTTKYQPNPSTPPPQPRPEVRREAPAPAEFSSADVVKSRKQKKERPGKSAGLVAEHAHEVIAALPIPQQETSKGKKKSKSQKDPDGFPASNERQPSRSPPPPPKSATPEKKQEEQPKHRVGKSDEEKKESRREMRKKEALAREEKLSQATPPPAPAPAANPKPEGDADRKSSSKKSKRKETAKTPEPLPEKPQSNVAISDDVKPEKKSAKKSVRGGEPEPKKEDVQRPEPAEETSSVSNSKSRMQKKKSTVTPEPESKPKEDLEVSKPSAKSEKRGKKKGGVKADEDSPPAASSKTEPAGEKLRTETAAPPVSSKKKGKKDAIPPPSETPTVTEEPTPVTKKEKKKKAPVHEDPAKGSASTKDEKEQRESPPPAAKAKGKKSKEPEVAVAQDPADSSDTSKPSKKKKAQLKAAAAEETPQKPARRESPPPKEVVASGKKDAQRPKKEHHEEAPAATDKSPSSTSTKKKGSKKKAEAEASPPVVEKPEENGKRSKSPASSGNKKPGKKSVEESKNEGNETPPPAPRSSRRKK